MKKQKRPFFLVLFVLILFGVVAFMNRDQTPAAPPTPDATPQTDKKDVASQVGSQLKDDKPKTPKPNHKPGMMKGGPGMNTPSILKVHYEQTKPKPQDSSTSTQWYTPQTGKS